MISWKEVVDSKAQLLVG